LGGNLGLASEEEESKKEGKGQRSWCEELERVS